MTDPTIHVRFRPAGVHADVIGDEAIVVNFATGRYYTIAGTGAYIVKALTKGPVRRDAMLSALEKAYPGLASRLSSAQLDAFLEELRAEGLTEIYAYEGPAVPLEFEGEYGFLPINIETRLADILTLDPIHDVSSEGWPKQ